MSSSSQECHLFLIKLILFQFGCHDNHENLVIAFLICLTDCEKYPNFSVPNNGDMADCFFLHDEMINCDVTNSVVLHLYDGTEENDVLLLFFSKI